MSESADLDAAVAETATVIVRVTPATKAELNRRAAEFYAVHQVRPSMDTVIRQALADRKPVRGIPAPQGSKRPVRLGNAP